ncbi:MAG: FecR domain-containing protein [Saprospiraceae bacterium]
MAFQHGKVMQEQDFILLLTKQFSGDISSAETDDLQKWLDQSPDNQQFAAEWRQVWDKAGTYTPAFRPDLAADFRKVQDRIRNTAVPKARIVPLGQRLLRVAAMLAFLLGAFWIYRTFVHPPLAQLSASAGAPMRELTLPDGSQVWLRQGATLDFPQKFAGKERRVRLRGEAYFDVAHLANQPFRVELPDGGLVEVLGTQFDIRQGDQQNSVLVRSGRVRFYTDQKGGKTVLNPGEKATYNLPTNTTQQTKVTSFNELAWQAGGLEFIKTPLSTVVTDLEQYYHVQIVLRNPALHNCLHTAPLTNQPLDKVLQSLSLTYQLKVLRTAPSQYELVGGTCR